MGNGGGGGEEEEVIRYLFSSPHKHAHQGGDRENYAV